MIPIFKMASVMDNEQGAFEKKCVL